MIKKGWYTEHAKGISALLDKNSEARAMSIKTINATI